MYQNQNRNKHLCGVKWTLIYLLNLELFCLTHCRRSRYIFYRKTHAEKNQIRVYKTVIRLIFDVRLRTLDADLKRRTHVISEGKKSGKSWDGLKTKDWSWRIKNNLEIDCLISESRIFGETYAVKLCWLGQMEIMEEKQSVFRTKRSPERLIGPRY